MSVRLNGSSSGYTELDAGAVAGNNTIKLPTSNGAANQFLKNSGTAGTQTYSQATEDSAGVFAFNSGYGSAAPVYGCRAWVNFDGTAAGTFAGGTSTVTRVAGSTTATITTFSPHGLLVGHGIYAASGVVAGAYTVASVPTSTQFTITTVATTALSAAAITFNFANIRAAGNVNSVAKNGTGDYAVNFSTAMPDANYILNGSVGNNAASCTVCTYGPPAGAASLKTTSQLRIATMGASALFDFGETNVTIFR